MRQTQLSDEQILIRAERIEHGIDSALIPQVSQTLSVLQRGDQQFPLRADLLDALELNQRVRDVAKPRLNRPLVLRQRAALLRFS